MIIHNFCYTLEITGKTARGESFAQRRDGKIHQKFGPQNIAYHHINSKSNLKVSLYVKKAQWKRVIKPNFTYFHTNFISILYF